MAGFREIEQLCRNKDKYTVRTNVYSVPEKEILQVAQIAADKHFHVKTNKETGERITPDGVYTVPQRNPLRVSVFADYGFVQVNITLGPQPEKIEPKQ